MSSPRLIASSIKSLGYVLLSASLVLVPGGALAQTSTPAPIPTVAKPAASASAAPGAAPADSKSDESQEGEDAGGAFPADFAKLKLLVKSLTAVCASPAALEADILRAPVVAEVAKANQETNRKNQPQRVTANAQLAAATKDRDDAERKLVALKKKPAGAVDLTELMAAQKEVTTAYATLVAAAGNLQTVEASVLSESPEGIAASFTDTIQRDVCAQLCPAAHGFCGANEELLAAMLLAAPDEVDELKELIHAGIPEALHSLPNSADGASTPLAVLVRESGSAEQFTSAGLDGLPAVAASVLQGLSKLIVDRGKAEAVGWLLDKMGDDLCGRCRNGACKEDPKRATAQAEIREYWLPNVCALALGDRLSGYGGGGAMLASLQRAVELDLRQWPGTLASFAPAAAYLSDQAPPKPAVVDCSSSSAAYPSLCRDVTALRVATRLHVGEIVSGRDPLAVLRELATSYSQTNGVGAAMKSKKLSAMSCGLALPEEFRSISKKLAASLSGNKKAHAVVLTAAVSAEGCFSLLMPTKPQFPQWEKLSGLLWLEQNVGGSAGALGVDLGNLEAAVAELNAAKEALSKQVESVATAESATTTPPEGADPNSVFETALALKSGEIAGKLGPAQARLARAVIGLADAAMGVARRSLLVAAGSCKVAGAACNTQQMTEAASRLEEMRAWLTVAAEATTGDLGKSAIALLGAVQASTVKEKLRKSRELLLKHVGLLVAIATAKDSDGIARALDQAAAPVGGWRGKGVEGSTTISVTAHPGLISALELRNGTYGADREDWKSHFQAPTLALPVGLEIAWGGGPHDEPESLWPVGFFFPLLDPVAFLQYDAEKDARLPGASLKTALSPGVGFRLGVPESPFSFIPIAVYRPGFRQWHSDFNGTGADAFQLGLLLSVDVTLYELSRKEAN